MRFWPRRNLGWGVVAVTLISLPGPMSAACACTHEMMDTPCAQGTVSTKKGCPRCQIASSSLATSQSAKSTQISSNSCCKSKITDARSATTPVRVQLQLHETRTTTPAAAAPAPAVRSTGTRSTRAPPSRGARHSASPPASYLSDYLRL